MMTLLQVSTLKSTIGTKQANANKKPLAPKKPQFFTQVTSETVIFLYVELGIRANFRTLYLARKMQATLATLLLITSAVMLTCVVVDYAVGIFVNVLQTDNLPQIAKIRDLESMILNQTDNLFNQTENLFTNPAQP